MSSESALRDAEVFMFDPAAETMPRVDASLRVGVALDQLWS